jgi:two-component system copper resistance phosphate regulon response regulator CusR
VDGAPLPLTPREFALLALLLRHRGRAFSRAGILERLAGSDADVSDRSVEVLVHGLRRKLDAAGLPGLVETRRGAGYLIP